MKESIDRKTHWEEIYKTRPATEVSWFQENPAASVDLIRQTGVSRPAPILDAGGGASRLADHLLAAGFTDITVLDISAEAIQKSQERLGSRAHQVKWLVGDITKVDLPKAAYSVWHDRAVFHFFTGAEDKARYKEKVRTTLQPGGHLILATFALTGPPQCSGLPVARYSAQTLSEDWRPDFRLANQREESHQTPSGKIQNFIYVHFQRAE